MNYEQKIDQIITGDCGKPMPSNASILAKYLENFRPTSQLSDTNKTSAELVEDLSEIVELSINDVASVMDFLGYELVENCGLEWGMTYHFE